jgi:FAD/FMN-containing dehydrogenase
VLADGRVVECNERRDEDLFRAFRGAGGGTLGVVTSLDFATVPARPGTAFHLIWPHSATAAVIGAWQVWVPNAPD